METLEEKISDTKAIAPIADDNIQLRRAVYWLAQTSQRTDSVTDAGVRTTSGTILEVSKARAEWSIQNVGTNPLFVKFGAGASATSFNVVLAGGDADKDGKGGFLSSDKYFGIISVYGVTPKYVVTEF